MQSLNEDLVYVEELIRKVQSLLSPFSVHSELEWLMDPKNREMMFEKHPKCWMPVRIGRDVPFFPVCNRLGTIEPDVIDFSLRIARKLCKKDEIDQEHLQSIIQKLQTMKRKYEGDTPKPPNMAYKKGLTTRMFNNIKTHLKSK